MRKTMKISGLLGALLFAVGGVEAAGLGKLSVQSALGQPLKAEIELLSINKDELPTITARLAGADAFKQARIDRIAALAALRFSVEQRANGQPVIRVSSSVPIADPFLDMLIEVNWNSGRLLREYTILLDPPVETRPAPMQAVMPPEMARPAQQQPAPIPERRAVVESARPKAPEPVIVKQPKRYGPVKSGETLRGIAARVKQENVTLEQMMVGLYQANKGAFQADNMNRLKRGQVLNVPDAEAVHLQVSPAQAAHTIQGHTADWHAYRKRVAEMAVEAPDARMPEPAAGKLAPKHEAMAPPAAAPRDMLKLSKGEPGSIAGRPDPRVQEKLQSLEEELAAKGRALQEAQDRVGQLERTVRDMQKLLELRAQEAATAPPAPRVVPPAEPAQPPVAITPEPEPAPAAPPPPVQKAKPAAVVLPEPVEQSSTSWISTFISNPLYIGGIVAAVLLSVLLWMMMVGSRRRHGLNKFEDSIMTGGEFKNNAVFNATTPASGAGTGANTEGSMLLTDFSRLGLGAIDTHEVDPIAEAEVYMAYGRDAQAEEILKEALNKDPSRHEIALKLLEIYAARKDTQAFEAVASELYAGLGGEGTPVWQRAAEMGRSIDPSNPLYRASASEAPNAFAAKPASRPIAAAPVMAPSEDFSQDLEAMDDWDASELTVGRDDDFDIPAAAPPAAPRGAARATEPSAPVPPSPKQESFNASLPEQDFSLEFESALPPPVAPESTPEADDLSWALPTEPTEPEMEAESVLEFDAAVSTEREPAEDLEFEATAVFDEVSEPVEEHESVPVLDLSGIDLELESESEPVLASELDTPASIEVEHLAEMPVSEVPDTLEFEPSLEAPASAEDFAPDLVEEFTPEPVPESAEPQLETPAIPEPAALPEAEAASVAEAPVDPELWEEVNTKLDLARAYLEMGDQEGAREILQEVLSEGDPQQKADADKLLAEAA